jgi:ribosomal-protein-alanine N-acetyltransferase
MPLEGKIVVLREERREDQRLFTALRNDMETQGWNVALPPNYTEEMHIKRFEAQEFSYERYSARFSIVQKDSGQLVGFITYSDLEPRVSVAIGIAIRKESWGPGIALDAQEVLLEFLFNELGVRVVHLWTHSGNPRAEKLAEKSGFRTTARVREGMYKRGRLLDILVMSVLREEYYAGHPELEDTLPYCVVA